jgi:phosphopantothenoylcysteine synthetase/decarboxylase
LRKKNDQRFAIVEQVAGPVIAPAPPQVKVTIKAASDQELLEAPAVE